MAEVVKRLIKQYHTRGRVEYRHGCDYEAAGPVPKIITAAKLIFSVNYNSMTSDVILLYKTVQNIVFC